MKHIIAMLSGRPFNPPTPPGFPLLFYILIITSFIFLLSFASSLAHSIFVLLLLLFLLSFSSLSSLSLSLLLRSLYLCLSLSCLSLLSLLFSFLSFPSTRPSIAIHL